MLPDWGLVRPQIAPTFPFFGAYECPGPRRLLLTGVGDRRRVATERGRRTFGTIERRRGAFRARYFGPDRVRYEAPRAFTARLDAEHWLAETQREISRGTWKPPQSVQPGGADLETLAGYARHCLAERDLTPRTREEYDKLLENLILPTLGKLQLGRIQPDRIRRWYSTVLSADRPTQRKHAYALLRSILREAEDEGPHYATPSLCRLLRCAIRVIASRQQGSPPDAATPASMRARNPGWPADPLTDARRPRRTRLHRRVVAAHPALIHSSGRS